MNYPTIVDYNEAVQNPAQAFVDSELKRGVVKENNLGLPLVLSGGFALTYTVSTPSRKSAVRCFKQEIPAIEQKYNAISRRLKSLSSAYFVNFDFQQSGIIVRKHAFPVVRMDWVDGDPLGIWLDKNFDNPAAVQKARTDFTALASFLEREGIAHGDIQNLNVMMPNGRVKLIDYDGMFVPGSVKGSGSEIGDRNFQHSDRVASDYGPTMDRFSFIALDLSLQAVIEDKTLYKRFRDGGNTIIFKANDFADPRNSEIFRILLTKPKLSVQAQDFAAICDADLAKTPTLEDFLGHRKIPLLKAVVVSPPGTKAPPRVTGYIAAFPVLDAMDFATAARRVGDRVELVGQITDVTQRIVKRGRGQGRPFVFINFGSWRGSIVKISIWSDGLDNLKEKPSAAWIGQWISVTGLMDPAYVSTRYGYTHLSITVQEDGQIQRLVETEALFRLASIGKATPQRYRGVAGASAGTSNGGSNPVTGGRPATATTNENTRNRDIVNRYKGGTAARPPGAQPRAPVTGTQPASQGPPKPPSASIPLWVWVALGVVALLVYLRVH